MSDLRAGLTIRDMGPFGTGPVPDPLGFAALRTVNVRRCDSAFQSHGGLQGWGPTEWALAMVGEAGEVCNAVKKLIRGDGSVEAIGKELADTVIYADLLAARLGIDLGAAVRAKFDEVSDRVGSNVKLGPARRSLFTRQQP